MSGVEQMRICSRQNRGDAGVVAEVVRVVELQVDHVLNLAPGEFS
jgi:hypothetical protein